MVWKHYGGGHVCVPDKLTAEHTLAVTIGLEAASLLSQHFGKEILVIPKLQKIRDAIRNKSICQLRQEGWDLFKLARKFDLTERQISTICQSRVVVDVGQLDLFV